MQWPYGVASRPGRVEILLVTSCYRNWDRLWPDELFGSNADFTFTYQLWYFLLENNPKQICMLIGLKPCFYNLIARAVDVMMARTKRIYILMIEVIKHVDFLFLCRGIF